MANSVVVISKNAATFILNAWFYMKQHQNNTVPNLTASYIFSQSKYFSQLKKTSFEIIIYNDDANLIEFIKQSVNEYL